MVASVLRKNPGLHCFSCTRMHERPVEVPAFRFNERINEKTSTPRMTYPEFWIRFASPSFKSNGDIRECACRNKPTGRRLSLRRTARAEKKGKQWARVPNFVTMQEWPRHPRRSLLANLQWHDRPFSGPGAGALGARASPFVLVFRCCTRSPACHSWPEGDDPFRHDSTFAVYAHGRKRNSRPVAPSAPESVGFLHRARGTAHAWRTRVGGSLRYGGPTMA